MSALGIAHRNIKPEAIMIKADGMLKLGSTMFMARGGERAMFTLCGTPEYMAPEIIKNKGHDCRVDVWSLGILLYELLHGFPPFCAEDPMEIYQKILIGEYPFADHVPEQPKLLIKQMVQQLPADRVSASALLCPGSWLPESAVRHGIPELVEMLATIEVDRNSTWQRCTAAAPDAMEDSWADRLAFFERL